VGSAICGVLDDITVNVPVGKLGRPPRQMSARNTKGNVGFYSYFISKLYHLFCVQFFDLRGFLPLNPFEI
jgi:hypothetical protein